MSKRSLSFTALFTLLLAVAISTFFHEGGSEEQRSNVAEREEPSRRQGIQKSVDLSSESMKSGLAKAERVVARSHSKSKDASTPLSQLIPGKVDPEKKTSSSLSDEKTDRERTSQATRQQALSSQSLISEFDRTKGSFSRTGLKARFVTGDRKPAVGLTLIVFASAPSKDPKSALRTPLSTPRERVLLGADGRFQLVGLNPQRSYNIVVVGSEVYASNAFRAPALEKDQVKDCGQIVVAKAAMIQGRVVNHEGKAIPAKLLKLNGLRNSKPIVFQRRGELRVSPLGRTVKDIEVGHTLSIDEKGHFQLTGLPAGRYTLTFTSNGLRSGERRGLSLKAGDRIKGVKIVLGVPATAKIRVVNSLGQPVEGALCYVAVPESPLAKSFLNYSIVNPHRPRLPASLPKTDLRGEYLEKSLVEAHYLLCVQAPGHELYASIRTVSATGETVWGVRLRAGRVAVGKVVNAVTNLPIEGATVTTTLLNGAPGAYAGRIVQKTNSRGLFQTLPLAPGHYKLQVNCEDFMQRSQAFIVKRDSSSELKLKTIALTPQPQIEFLVLDPQSLPVSDAIITMTYHSESPLERETAVAKTNEQGSAIGTLAPGVVTFKVEADGFAFGVLSKQRITENDQSFTIRLVKRNEVRGSVFNSEGKPIPNGTLVFFRAGERIAFARCASDGHGKYLIRSLAPGSYQVLLNAGTARDDPHSGFPLTVTRQDAVYADIQLSQ